MDGSVVEIIKKYLETSKIKQQKKFSRLKYDDDAKYYYEKGYLRKEAFHADTIISFWTIYKRLLKIETGLSVFKSGEKITNLLNLINSNNQNEITHKIIDLNKKLEDFAKLIYKKGNFMLLPDGKRMLNTKRYFLYEDRIDMSLYNCFSGGKLSYYFDNDECLREWIIREKLEILFDGEIKKENLKWFLDNEKKFSDMGKEEIYKYIDAAKEFISEREKYIEEKQ